MLLGNFWNGSAAACCRATVSETKSASQPLATLCSLEPKPLYLSSPGLSQICVDWGGRGVPIKGPRLSEFEVLLGTGT